MLVRRALLYNSGVILSRRALLGTAAASILRAQPERQRLKIVVAGGHPGDPECGCAGTIARYADLGHEVTLLYLNRGEGFCGGAALDRCGEIRTAEATAACRILKAKPVFAEQSDGRVVVDDEHYTAFARLLAAEKPAIVFTQWPVDSHRDHRALAALTLDAWLKAGRGFALYFYEVAEDTSMFTPGDYVDTTMVEARRHAACYAHASQQPDKWYPKQTAISRFRGGESGFRQAEAFAKHPESRRGFLP